MREIRLWGVRQNNLKNIDVNIPLGSFTVICGPSGSGKSSLAFETLFAEGQRRFIESMSTYARQFLNKAPKPDLDGIENIPPAIAIEQKNSVKNSRSTVGTTTEVLDLLRLLFEKIGKSHCPKHLITTENESVSEATKKTLRHFRGQRGFILAKISQEARVAEGKKLHSLLLQEGYLRIFIPPKKKKTSGIDSGNKFEPPQVTGGVFQDLGSQEVIKKGLPSSDFYLVVDRLAFEDSESGRLSDSLGQAYEASIKFNKDSNTRRSLILTTEFKSLLLSEELSCHICGYTPPQVTSKLFSFNSPMGACTHCKGFGNTLEIDETKVIPNPKLSIEQGALNPFTMPSAAQERKALFNFCKKHKINLKTPWQNLSPDQREMIWKGHEDFFGVKGLFEYLEQMKYKMHVRVFLSRYRTASLCGSCGGTRLRPEVDFVLVHGKSINELSKMTLEGLHQFVETIELSPLEVEVAKEVLKQLKDRLNYLVRVGVPYLTLNRETRSLSGGEYQRLMLANQLGMGLSQTLFVLDEPTVGLHPRDSDRLISILKDIQQLGNTLVVVEHDHDVIRSSSNLIEMGPGSGFLGGKVIYSGNTQGLLQCKDSNTAPHLGPRKWLEPNISPELRLDLSKHKYKLQLRGARGNNLKSIDVDIPLNKLVTVTGVSGSGKSTLVTKTLYPALARELGIDFLKAQDFDSLSGIEHLKNVVLLDQNSIGKSARSSPITYIHAFDTIRSLLAGTKEAKDRAYTPGFFSLNVDGGRCPTCRGNGVEEIDMMFMDNVTLPCDVCDGKRYRKEVLEVQYHGKNVSQILDLTVQEAMDFFVTQPSLRKPLSVLKEVGLGYLRLGQPASTLSGGESQRLKIAKELSRVTQNNCLYILDEPTTGLHFNEVKLLMKVLHKLISAGGSVLLVEHNLDVIIDSDYVLDLGPEAGKNGGTVVAQGSPADIMNSKESLTGRYLRRHVGKK